jgi:predicted O-methyltransferase YrrM
MEQLRKIVHSLFHQSRIAVLDYPVNPFPVYSKENPNTFLLQLFEEKKKNYEQLLQSALQFKDVFLNIREEKVITNETEPGWNNLFLPGMDMVMLYTILSTIEPKQYIEIGSGTSTKIAAKAKAEQQLNYHITCIDPFPRKEISTVADQWLSVPLQKAPLSLFENMEENDVLFFDGSHLLHANSDVQWFFMEVLPRLKKGVVVQVHDIYLPYDYPQNMCNRFYAEQYMLATAILSNPEKFEIQLPNFYISEDDELKKTLQPIWNELPAVETHGGSFWFRISK